MRFSRTRISPSFADICTPVLRYPRNDLTGRASGFCLKTLQGAGVRTTADGAKHRWPKIVQVGRCTVKAQVFEESVQVKTCSQALVPLRSWQRAGFFCLDWDKGKPYRVENPVTASVQKFWGC